jgi:hypothetical protein
MMNGHLLEDKPAESIRRLEVIAAAVQRVSQFNPRAGEDRDALHGMRKLANPGSDS